jgi:hypothetical protein
LALSDGTRERQVVDLPAIDVADESAIAGGADQPST